jgi:hypothetical protein
MWFFQTGRLRELDEHRLHDILDGKATLNSLLSGELFISVVIRSMT